MYIDDEYADKEKTRRILADALSLAEHANNVKFDFLLKMSHDIRTPLNAIIGMTTIIASNLDNKEKINECLVKIGMSSKHLLGIINGVLDYSKIESGNLLINRADFNLRDLIAEIANDISILAQTKQQTVEFSVDEQVSNSYIGDSYRTSQVLKNLLDNAYKYTPVGGRYSLKVNVSMDSGDYDVLSFVVEDNGVGIHQDFIDKIFEPFEQEESSHNVESVGLGLAISRNLAHIMNGDLGVTSEYGKGSCFTFEIPLEKGNLKSYSEILDTNINVLVVDDEIEVCEHTATLLNNMGISAMIADNGPEAVRLVKANMGTPEEFDVAIIDWKMPEMDGVETVRRIRKFVGKFADDANYSELVEAFKQKDIRKAEMASHTLKGMCGNLSIQPLFDLFTEQVNLIRSGEIDKAEDIMGQISAFYSEAILCIKEWLYANAAEMDYPGHGNCYNVFGTCELK